MTVKLILNTYTFLQNFENAVQVHQPLHYQKNVSVERDKSKFTIFCFRQIFKQHRDYLKNCWLFRKTISSNSHLFLTYNTKMQ